MAYEGVPHRAKLVNFLGLSFNVMDRESALDTVAARATLGGRFSYVVTPNVDHIVKLADDPARAALYDQAWLRLNDSRVLASLAERAGLKLPAAPGSDLAEGLFDRVIDRREPITIIGGDP
ncbi:MAG: WecB/TagA/CpsF family glycosyltransferase, partial [Hyphomonadaceae bacterium]